MNRREFFAAGTGAAVILQANRSTAATPPMGVTSAANPDPRYRYISQAGIDLFRNSRIPLNSSWMVDRTELTAAFQTSYSWFSQEIRQLVLPGVSIPDIEYQALHAAFVAYDFGTYGDDRVPLDLAGLLGAQRLVCNQYCNLAFLIFQAANPTSSIRFNWVGWAHGAIGNHAQLFITSSMPGFVPMLVDPTCLIFAPASFDTVARGDAIPLSNISVLYPRSEIVLFRDKVTAALVNGEYRPSHLLYYFNAGRYYNESPTGATIYNANIAYRCPDADFCAPARQDW